jgi:regulator of sigma D
MSAKVQGVCMLEQCDSKEDRFIGVQQMINHWLEERQELVVAYCDISGINSIDKGCSQSSNKLKGFCQLLIDYVSAGHFEIYDQLIKEAEAFSENTNHLIAHIYPKIAETTDIALDFHETYDTQAHCEAAQNRIKTELSILGEAISQRFNFEDELIAVMHDAHAIKLEASEQQLTH